MTNTDIQTIQEELITKYEAISLPVLGTPTGYKQEPDGGFASADLPAVVVTRGIKTTIQYLSAETSIVTREYITDLYCYIMDDDDPVNATARNNTADCIPSIEAAFNNPHLLTTTNVIGQSITADTDDVELYARDDTTNYVGVRFRHEITYMQFT